MVYSVFPRGQNWVIRNKLKIMSRGFGGAFSGAFQEVDLASLDMGEGS